MGQRYCRQCGRVVEVKVIGNYSQLPYNDILVKRRKVGCLIEDGGCGTTWYTLELPEDILVETDED